MTRVALLALALAPLALSLALVLRALPSGFYFRCAQIDGPAVICKFAATE